MQQGYYEVPTHSLTHSLARSLARAQLARLRFGVSGAVRDMSEGGGGVVSGGEGGEEGAAVVAWCGGGTGEST